MLLALGGAKYEDEAVWGTGFQYYKQQGVFPFAKTPVMVVADDIAAKGSLIEANKKHRGDRDNTLLMADKGVVVAQSGSLARYAAKIAGRYPTDHTACAVSDSIFELGQELCTINPLVNCYVDDHFERVKQHYFRDVMPVALPQLEQQLSVVGTKLAAAAVAAADDECGDGGVYFAGTSATYGDINIFHMLNNALLLEPDLLVRTPCLEDWYWRMAALPGLKEYLASRPTLNGIGKDPGLEDRNGVRVTQRTSPGRGWLVDGCWQLEPLQ